MRSLTRWLLGVAESLFLRAHGWTKLDHPSKDLWARPSWYEAKRNGGEPYRTGHAVNSQKWTNQQDERAKRMREAGWV